MAKADYKLCDVCGEKAFYDANLNYEQPAHGLYDLEGRDISTKLDFCAQHVAVCVECYEKGWRLRLSKSASVAVAS